MASPSIQSRRFRVGRGRVRQVLMAERQPETVTLNDVVAYLNAVQVRATYGAVAKLVGGIAQSIGSRLGGSSGKRPDVSWVVSAENGLPTDYAPEQLHPALLRSNEVISSGPELRRRLAEWNAAGRPGRPKGGGSAEAPPPLPKPAAPQASSLSVDTLASLVRRLSAILNAFEPRVGGPSESIQQRIERLSQADGPIPRHIAALMVTITEMRNTAEHESTVLSASECAVVRNAWQAIQEWVRSRPGKTA